ncbi:tetratricopeptide repeat protein [Actinacidiphila reveromycinica]|uniref:tetratricopeptide repeat protein n=1 Tax=Actinacidiphila reveromycinica TaxID=659352 RepID=UPI001921E71E|nr:tetratricopeptide repeat protein [Streptomyces sp. SN-593]
MGELTGRDEELRRLLALLDPASGAAGAGAVVVSAVAGLAGVGKTTLAVHAAHQAVGRGWFPGGHLFLDLRGYEPAGQVTAEQALGALLRAVCGADAELPDDLGEQAGLYRSQMADLSLERGAVLLVLDSASTAAQVEPLLPGGAEHRVLVTSRHTLASLPATLLDLAVLEPADAAAMIAKFLGAGDVRPGREPGALAELAGYCGHLPLALQITAANLKADPRRSLAGLAAELRDEQARLGLSYSDEGQTLAVRASFELSYRRLPAAQARLFRLLSLNPTPESSLDAVAALTCTPADEARRIAVGLAQAHLIEPVTEDRWRMHDLMRLYATDLATHPDGYTDQSDQNSRDDQAEALDRLLDHFANTADAANDHLRALPGQPVPDRFRDRADALAWLEAEHTNLVTAVTRTATTHPRIALTLAISLAVFLGRGRHFGDAITTGHHALAAARRLGDRHREGIALNNFGNALWEVRRFEEAIAAYDQVAGIFRETGDRHREAVALGNLGNALAEVRRFQESVASLTQVAGIFREIGDRHGEGMALGNLGVTLAEVGRFEEAIDAHHQDLAICRETGDRHGEGAALNNLGIALRKLRRLEESVASLTQAADIFREIGDRHGEGMALGNLGVTLAEVGRFEEAIAAYNQDLAICRETGDRHGEGIALNNLGIALRKLRRFEEAVAAHNQAVLIYRETGDRHREGEALNDLADVLKEARVSGRIRRLWHAVTGTRRADTDQPPTTDL